MYEAPIKDLNFVIKNIIDLNKLSEVDDYKEFSDDLVEAVLEEAGKIATEVLDPCNLSGDHEGSKRQDDGKVVTPKGYKEAYESSCHLWCFLFRKTKSFACMAVVPS